jgi:uncharacterized protein YeaC (DUF1315 family)
MFNILHLILFSCIFDTNNKRDNAIQTVIDYETNKTRTNSKISHATDEDQTIYVVLEVIEEMTKTKSNIQALNTV